MKIINLMLLLLLQYGVTSCADHNEPDQTVFVFEGMSDASAAVALSRKMFIVADDENNMLRVYKIESNSAPVFSYDLTSFLGIAPKHPEADIEAATMVGERIYWITSHGRNKDGKMRPNRYRFFATSVKVKDQSISISPVGTPCQTLVQELVRTESMCKLDLQRATRFSATNLKEKERTKLAPKKQGLNIEGLCASPDGKTIYIGFRNPRPRSVATGRGQALVVALNNPSQVIEKAEEPIFGEPILWDLGGLGIRSMEYSHFYEAYFIVAGPHDGQSRFALYRWSGKKDTPPILVREIDTDKSKFTPEALVVFDNSDSFWLLSDDGSLTIDVSDASECMKGKLLKNQKCLNKHLTCPSKKCFRGMWLKP